MKKSTKLLSLILAIVMLFSSLGITSFAATLLPSKIANDTEIYDGNDKAQASLLTYDQRATSFLDFLDGVLGPLNIRTYLDLSILGAVQVDITSTDMLFETLRQIKKIGILTTLGDLQNLDLSTISGNKGEQTRANKGDIYMVETLIKFLNQNGALVGSVLDGLNIGVGNGFLPANIKDLLNDIPGLLKGLIYDAGVKRIANGIGEDTTYPHVKKWIDLTPAEKPSLDNIAKNLIINLLTKPTWECFITDKNQNSFSKDPANEPYVRSEQAKGSDGMPLYDATGSTYNYYYVYKSGINTYHAKAAFTDADAVANNIPKTYICHYDPNSIILKGDNAAAQFANMTFKSTSFYQILDEAIPLVFDMLAVKALNSDLRTTLLKFAGAKFVEVPMYTLNTTNLTEEHKAVYNQVKQYAAMDEKAFEAAAKQNANLAGSNRYFFIKVGDKNYNVVSTSPAEQNTKIYAYSMEKANTNGFADMINWDYQIGNWASLTAGLSCATKGNSVLKCASDLVGKIINQAVLVKGSWAGWAMDPTSGQAPNAKFKDNLTNIVKYVLKTEPGIILGEGTVLPGDFDSFNTEQVLVYIASDIMNWLMPSIVLPKDVRSLEELIVYAVRELMAEIYPEYGAKWDAQIASATAFAGAKREGAFLDIALNMGMSTAVYYLKNFIGYGSVRGGAITSVPYDVGPDVSWREILCDIIDWAVNNYLKSFSSEIKKDYPNVFVDTNDDPFNRLSLIVNVIFPHVGTLISGCGDSATGTFNFETLFGKFKSILNGDLEPLVSCAYRTAGGIGNTGLAEVIFTFLLDIFDGFGFDKQSPISEGGANNNDWNGFKNAVLWPLSQTEPLEALVSKGSLVQLVQNLLWVLGDWRSIWFEDASMLITMISGTLWEMQYKGASQTTDKAEYFGAATADIIASFQLTTTGVREVVYKSGYKMGEFKQYDAFSAVVKKMEILEMDGKTVVSGQSFAPDAPLAANTVYSHTFNVPAAADPKAYIVKTTYQVNLPTGGVLGGATKTFDTSKVVVVGSQSREHKGYVDYLSFGHNFDVYTDKVLYLDENASLSNLDGAKLTLQGMATKYLNSNRNARLRMEGLGNQLTLSADGTTLVPSYLADRNAAGQPINLAKAGKFISYDSNGTRTEVATGSVPFWPNALINYNEYQIATRDWGPAMNYWIANPSAFRSQYPDDFKTFYYQSDLNNTGAERQNNNYGAKWLGNWTLNKDDMDDTILNSTLIMYNSYGLGKMLSTAFNSDLNPAAYTAKTWTNYVRALNEAVKFYYSPWSDDAATFITNMKIDDDSNAATPAISEFKYNADRLDRAVKGLVSASAGSAIGHTPTELAEIKAVADGVKAKQEKIANYKDYALYTYKRFEAPFNNVMWNANKVIAPAKTGDKTLVGVNLGTNEITSLVSGITDAKTKAIVEKMVKEPTSQANIDAAARYAAWEKDAKIDLNSYQVGAANATKFADTIVAKYTPAQLNDTNGTGVKYYLKNAIDLVEKAIAAGAKTGMTAESIAKLDNALTKAKAVLANTTSSHSNAHEARYALLIAYRNLLGTKDAADFSALEAAIATANKIIANATIDATLDPKVEALMTVLGQKATLTTGTAPKQTVEDYWIGGNGSAKAVAESKGLTSNAVYVDATTKKLTDAIAAFFNLVPTKTGQVDNSVVAQKDFVISGVNPATIADEAGLKALVQLAGMPAGVNATIEADFSQNAGKKGTGAKVNVMVEGKSIFSYTLVIFGDVNGDGTVDVLDAFASNRVMAGQTGFTGACKVASDINKDGVFSAADYTSIDAVLSGTPIAQK